MENKLISFELVPLKAHKEKIMLTILQKKQFNRW